MTPAQEARVREILVELRETFSEFTFAAATFTGLASRLVDKCDEALALIDFKEVLT